MDSYRTHSAIAFSVNETVQPDYPQTLKNRGAQCLVTLNYQHITRFVLSFWSGDPSHRSGMLSQFLIILISACQMLSLLYLPTFFFSIAFALPQNTGTSSQATCAYVITPSNQPDLFNIVYDKGPNFVYGSEKCNSTNQKVLLSTNWALLDYSPTISAVCGITSTASAIAGSWTWAWHTTSGTTCQAGLWQPGFIGRWRDV